MKNRQWDKSGCWSADLSSDSFEWAAVRSSDARRRDTRPVCPEAWREAETKRFTVRLTHAHKGKQSCDANRKWLTPLCVCVLLRACRSWSMVVYGNQVGGDVVDSGFWRRDKQKQINNTHSCYTTVALEYLYLYSEVLVSSAEDCVHVLQHELSRRLQEVKVQEEAQQRRSIQTLRIN